MKQTQTSLKGTLPEIRNHYDNKNYDDREVNKGKSLTIPDQSMSVAELMRRYASGLPLAGERVPFYDSDFDIEVPDLKKLDLAEIQELKEQYATQVEFYKKQLQEEQKEKGERFKQLEMFYETETKKQKELEKIEKQKKAEEEKQK